MSTAEKKAVKFLKGWRGYNTGEVAGFDADVVDTLVKNEVAVELGGKPSSRRQAAKKQADGDPPNSTGAAGIVGEGAGDGAAGSVVAEVDSGQAGHDNDDRP